MGIIFTILILGIIVFLHELGHFATAKYFGMPVSEFAIGMGPRIFSVRKGETVYSIRALPLGGFVNIEGMQPEKFDLEGFKKEKTDEIIEELKNETGNKYNDNEIEDEIYSGDEDTKFNLIEILSEDEDLLDAIALDDRDVIENMRNKALRILAENRREQRRKDYEHGFIQDD